MSETIWEKKMVYVVKIYLKEEDEEGNPINWTSSSEEYYADTLEEAEKMKERFLSGRDNYYGDLIEDVWISDEKEAREFLKNTDNKRQVEDRNASDIMQEREPNVPLEQRLFVDMDGTLAVFKPVDEMETLYEEGYFKTLEPQRNVVEAVRQIIKNHPEIEVNILSAYLTDSSYALKEKNEWLDRYLPEIDREHRIFMPCGTDKKEAIKDGIRSNDFLLDDYTKNLNEWQPPARGIKLLNSINHTRGSWPHDRIRYDRNPAELAQGIVTVMRNENRIFDKKIDKKKEESSKESVLSKLKEYKSSSAEKKDNAVLPHLLPKEEKDR